MSKSHFLWSKIYFNIEMYLWRGDTCHVGTLFQVCPRHRFYCIVNISVDKICVWFYVISDVFYFQHQYHTKSDEFLEKIQSQMAHSLQEKLVTVLENSLVKLARYDVGSLFSSVLSLTVRRHFYIYIYITRSFLYHWIS